MLLFSCERILPGGLIALKSIYCGACVVVLKKLDAFVLPSFSFPNINIILVTGVVGDGAVLLVYCSSWEKPLSPPQIIIKDSLLPKYLNFFIAAARATRRAYLYFVSLSFLLRHFMCRFMFKFSGCVINLIYEIVYLAIHTKSCLMYDVLKKD